MPVSNAKQNDNIKDYLHNYIDGESLKNNNVIQDERKKIAKENHNLKVL